jgi:hypothetical protein
MWTIWLAASYVTSEPRPGSLLWPHETGLLADWPPTTMASSPGLSAVPVVT